jgi:hypothetical protein
MREMRDGLRDMRERQAATAAAEAHVLVGSATGALVACGTHMPRDTCKQTYATRRMWRCKHRQRVNGACKEGQTARQRYLHHHVRRHSFTCDVSDRALLTRCQHTPAHGACKERHTAHLKRDKLAEKQSNAEATRLANKKAEACKQVKHLPQTALFHRQLYLRLLTHVTSNACRQALVTRMLYLRHV